MKYTAAAILLVSALMLSGCVEELSPEEKKFLDKTEYGLYRSGNDTFVYSDATHQTAVSSTQKSVRLQQDDMDRYLQLIIDGQLKKDGTVAVGIVSKNLSQTVTSANMSVLKVSSDKVWLWDEANATGYLMPFVE